MDTIPLFFTPSSQNSKDPVLRAGFPSLHQEYEVLLKIEKDGTSTRIEYTAEVKFEKFSPHSKNPILSIQRLTKTYINQTEPSTRTEEISDLAGSIFQPLELEINPKGESIRIFNYAFILKKWEEVKTNLQKNYAGQTLDSYIKNINQTLESPELVFEKLKNDWFLSLYCIPLYTQYTNPPEKEHWKFPSLVKGENTREYTLIKYSENLEDTVNSILIFVQDLDNPDTFTCIYTLDSKTKLIKNIEAVIVEKQGYSLRAEIQSIKSYTKEKENTPIPEKKKDFDEQAEWQKYQRKKKGFWGRWFDE